MAKAVTLANKPNDTRYFYPADENWVLKMLPFKASTAIAEGAAVQHETSWAAVTGNYTLMVAIGNIAGDDFYGIMAEPIVSTDADYATAWKLKGVRVPKTPYAQAFFSVGSGTFTAADVWATVALYTDYKSLAVDTLGLGATILKYISSTKGICMFNMPNTQVA